MGDAERASRIVTEVKTKSTKPKEKLSKHDIRTICAIVLVDKIQRAYVQSCGATVISKYAAMMSWVS